MAEAEGETESLGRRLRALRTELGTTLARLRRKVGLSASYSSQIERNETKASLATVFSIVKTLVEEFSHFFGHSIAVWHVVRESPEEFVFILKGQLEVRVGEEAFTLKAGDSIHCQGGQPHAWRNESGKECRLIWALSTPFLPFSERANGG